MTIIDSEAGEHTLKKCSTCDETKPIAAYQKDKGTACGYRSRCKACRKRLAREQMELAETNRPVDFVKQCIFCEETKAAEHFCKNTTLDGLGSECKDCARARQLWKNYGITLADYDDMLEAQGGVCAFDGPTCGIDRFGRFHVDHDHETGEVRGLLCTNCNKGLGMFQDDPQLLLTAAAYLIASKGER